MLFTLEDYKNHINLLRDYKYVFGFYGDEMPEKQVILRHDIDISIEIAERFAEFERSLDVCSTYFVLLRTDMYNPFSRASQKMLQKIADMGHEIGLHFDEKSYEIQNDYHLLSDAIQKEASILEQIIKKPVRTVSMHRPSAFTLEGDFEFKGLINCYARKYFNEYKYISDSRMHWREDLGEIIRGQKFNKLNILTHPFWYGEKEESTRDKLLHYIKSAQIRTYECLADNLRDIEEFVSRKDIL